MALSPQRLVELDTLYGNQSNNNKTIQEIFNPPETPSLTPQRLAELDQLYANHTPVKTENADDGFMSRVAQDVSKRRTMGQDIANAYTQGQSLPSTLWQTATKVGLGSANDVVAEGLTSAAQGGWDIVKQSPIYTVPYMAGKKIVDNLPESMRQAIGNNLNQTKQDLVNSDTAKEGAGVLKNIANRYEEFSQNHPVTTRNIEGLGNLIGAVPLAKGLVPAAGITKNAVGVGAEKAGQALEGAAVKQVANRRSDFIKDLVTPKQTASVREEQVGRTVEHGRLNKKIVESTPDQKEMADILSRLPVNQSNTLQGNYNVIKKQVGKEAQDLSNTLEKNDIFFPRKEFKAQFNNIENTLDESFLITGDAKEAAAKILRKMDSLVDKNKASASGLLKSRKELDNWIRSQKGEGVFDATKENAISLALKEIRNTTNTFIDSKAKNAGVKKSLRRQNLLYQALDNIAPKAAEEAPTAMGRFTQNLYGKIPLKTEVGKAAGLIAGTGIAGGAAAMLPQIALGGTALYGAGRALSSPILKKAVGKTLSTTGRALKK